MSTEIEVIGIYKDYGEYEKVIKGIDLKIESNSFNVLLGQSGSGKSTLLNIMSGLLKPSKGSIIVNATNINELDEKSLAIIRRNSISNIYQDYMLLPELTVKENIELGKGTDDNLKLAVIAPALGIDELLDKYPAQLSGGQKQRVAIARALIKKPKLLFCDEATGALDEENSKQVVKLLHTVKEKYGVTIIFATHNLKISLTADRVITIKDGKITKDVINQNPLSPMEIDWGIEESVNV
ncbi:putative ABC transport system ATP-binding protein [Pseudobutyrivibrio sp. UC1225]|uniref:ABC transporter ATP-binding protein n=1 Tax=Pseudobutyrivibrio sp. UC1225 TaxID=1798185 RepID=UPI0008E8EE12|nr:ABC transporter ATP-binding protein [Pseudobutyrivibrio sp. UC1225]SFO35925.1 putative ABC transport system ATP-binding protein [Pseudobutyrivibrio sp. UC1225]